MWSSVLVLCAHGHVLVPVLLPPAPSPPSMGGMGACKQEVSARVLLPEAGMLLRGPAGCPCESFSELSPLPAGCRIDNREVPRPDREGNVVTGQSCGSASCESACSGVRAQPGLGWGDAEK